MSSLSNFHENLKNVNSPKLSFGRFFSYKAKWLLAGGLNKILGPALEYRELQSLIAYLKSDLQAGNLERSGYIDHYTEANEMGVWYRYQKGFRTDTISNNEVVFRAQFVRDEIIRILKKDDRIRNVVNLGCSYGWLDSEVARYNGNVKVWGIDRSPQAMACNTKEFPLNNLKFVVAKNIFDFLEGSSPAMEDSIFCHINTGTYFLPSFLSKLYSSVKSAGGQYIVCFEPSGISRQIHKYYEYSEEPKDSVVFRGPMLIHNYPNILKTAGFSVLKAKVTRPPHPHPDFRSVCFIAKRL